MAFGKVSASLTKKLFFEGNCAAVEADTFISTGAKISLKRVCHALLQHVFAAV